MYDVIIVIRAPSQPLDTERDQAWWVSTESDPGTWTAPYVPGGDPLPDDYTAQSPKTDARFAFFAGERNACFLKQSQERSYDYFKLAEDKSYGFERTATLVRVSEQGEQIVSVAVPIQRFRAVLGVLLLSTQGGDIDFAPEAFPFMSYREGTVAGVAARVMRISFSGELAYEINVPADYGMALWEAVLDVGRARRLFTKGQRLAMAARDGGCTWPGCSAPPTRRSPARSRCLASRCSAWTERT